MGLMSVSSDDDYDEYGKLKQRPRKYSDWYVVKRISSFITKGKYRFRAIILLFSSIIGAIVGFMRPLLIQRIVNEGLGGGVPGAIINFESIKQSVNLLLIAEVISLFFWFFTPYLIQHLANR